VEGDSEIEDSGSQFSKTFCIAILVVQRSATKPERFVCIDIEEEINISVNLGEGRQCGHVGWVQGVRSRRNKDYTTAQICEVLTQSHAPSAP
jgi:hypothetical protein